MKRIFLTTALAAMIGTASFAGPFGLPDHVQNGFRDTGCDAAKQTPVKNADGEILYWNNPTCEVGEDPGEFEIAFRKALMEALND